VPDACRIDSTFIFSAAICRPATYNGRNAFVDGFSVPGSWIKSNEPLAGFPRGNQRLVIISEAVARRSSSFGQRSITPLARPPLSELSPLSLSISTARRGASAIDRCHRC
jgi:hypothetical protein